MKIEPMEDSAEPYTPKPRYPYGTSISVDGEMATELGYDKLSAGDYVEVRGMAFVSRKAEQADADDASEGEKENCLELQLVELNLTKAKVDRAKQLYGKEED